MTTFFHPQRKMKVEKNRQNKLILIKNNNPHHHKKKFLVTDLDPEAETKKGTATPVISGEIGQIGEIEPGIRTIRISLLKKHR